jgi:hypothetical protein
VSFETPDWKTTALVTLAALAMVLGWLAFAVGSMPWHGLELVPVLWLPLVMRSGAWSTWVRLLSRTEPATGLALFRIGLAISIWIILGGMISRNMITLMWVDVSDGGYRTIQSKSALLALLGGPTRQGVWALTGICLTAATLQMVGLGSRFMSLATMVTFGILTDLNSHAGGSYDELMKNGLFLLALGPSTATLSLDCRLRTGSWTSDVPVLAFARYLVVGQLVLMYWTTGLQKVSAHWMPGGSFDALYYILQQPSWQRFDMRWVAWFYPLTQLGTFASWCWEVTSPLWLLAFWFRATRTRPGLIRAHFNAWDVRTIYAVIGFVFHATLFVLMDVGPFSPISLSYYFCLFHPDEYRALWRWLRRKAGAG